MGGWEEEGGWGEGHTVGVKRPDTKRPRGETICLGQEMDFG